MSGYTPLFQSITTSSIWAEDVYTRILWVTMLALKDAQGLVEGVPSGLARSANIPIEECRKGLLKLESPDDESRSQEFEGRRIRKVDGGWQVINHHKYNERARKRAEYLRNWRESKKALKPSETISETKSSEKSTNFSPTTITTTTTTNLTTTKTNLRGGAHPSEILCVEFFQNEGYTDNDGMMFYENYTGKGWPDGDWQALARMWIARQKKIDAERGE